MTVVRDQLFPQKPPGSRFRFSLCMYVCMATHIARVWINRVRLPNPARTWSADQGKMNVSLSAFAPENLVSRDGIGSLVPRQPVYLYTTQAEFGACQLLVVVVVDSHIQRIVLATEETTVTQQVSHRPIKCQSRLWSQRGTKVNGSHHGDNPLLRPTGIQIATKSYAALQAMAPTNIKTVHQTSLLHIESNLDRLGMLSPTHDQRSQQKTGKITLQPVLINKSKFLKATHFVQK